MLSCGARNTAWVPLMGENDRKSAMGTASPSLPPASPSPPSVSGTP
uniref:Uncharacterized protein n=1 Tax=Anguilla anguilla TaxID=7936 RepID=A0A0E9RX92_ANGAN